MVWVKGPNYSGPATHGSSGNVSGNTQAMAPPGRSVTGPHDLSPQVAPPQMNTDDRQPNQSNRPLPPDTDPNINLVDELQALLDDTPTQVAEIPGQVVSDNDKIWELATQAAASNPGYELSFEGQNLIKKGIMPGSDDWIQYFGMPQVTSNINQVEKVDPMDPKYQKSFKGKELMDQGIMPGSKEWHNAFSPELQLSGQGKYLMDRYDNPTGSYQEQVADYYKMRDAEQQGQNDPGGSYGYGGGGGGSEGGSGYGYGYSGDDYPPPQGYQRAVFGPGNLQEQVNQNYMRLSGLHKKRGGIVSLLRLS